jgi:outer membrane protein assembly factor BamB
MKKIYFSIVFVFLSLWAVGEQNRLNWSFQTEGRVYSSPVADGSVIFFGSSDHHLYALNMETGAKMWDYESKGAIHSSPAIYNNFVFFTSADGNFYALEKSTGALAWKFATEGENVLDIWDYYISSPVISNSRVFFGSGDGNVYAINCADGTLIWQYNTGDIIHADPLILEDRLYIGNYAGLFFAMDAATGKVLWQFKTIGATYFPKGEVQKGAAHDEGIIYFGSRDYNIYALDAVAGHGHWNRREEGSWVIATPLVYDGNIYFGTSDTHKFYCIDKKSGSVVWDLPLPMRVYGTAVAHNGIIYFGCFDGIVRGADAQTGEIVWSFQTPASKAEYATIFDENGHFVEGFELYGQNYLEAERQIHALGSILSTPIIKKNIIYFGSSDGRLYSVNLSQ